MVLRLAKDGCITVILAALGRQPRDAVTLALFLHLGTAVSATAYYRNTIYELLTAGIIQLRGGESDAPLIFYLVATGVSGVVGIGSYAILQEIVSALTGGAVVIAIGALLIIMGGFQRASAGGEVIASPDPGIVDAILVGAAQGIAILPGITRSGMTTGTLLLRGYERSDASRLSFVLSIPAATGGGILAAIDSGLQGLTPTAAVAAFITAAIVGYLSIDVLLRIVERVAFWGVCIGLGTAAIVGGVLVI